MLGNLAAAVADIGWGLRRHELWRALAAEEISEQHRRTRLGPLWVTVNYILLAGTFIVLFGSAGPYPAYVATGLLVWLFVADAITQGVTLFTREEALIKGTPLPLSVFVLRLTAQSVMRGGYALAGCIGMLFFAGVTPNALWLWSAAGAALLVLMTPAAITVAAFAGVHFPDSRFLAGHAMRIGLFVTPVFWMDDGGGGLRGALHDLNPFTPILALVREPVVAGEVPVAAWAFCGALAVLLWLAALLLLGRARRDVALIL